jgi:hypothetical protein
VRRVLLIPVVVVVVAVLAIRLVGRSDDPAPIAAPGERVAHLWVTPDGCDSSPDRQSAPTSLADAPASARACTVDQAWDEADAGDIIRVACGTYGWQEASGEKDRETRVIGEPGCVRFAGTHECAPEFGAVSVFCILEARHLSLEDVTLDSGAVSGPASCFRVPSDSPRVTVRNLDCHGDQPFVTVSAPDFRWHRGDIGEDDDGLPRIRCDAVGGEPLWLFEEADRAVIDGVVFRKRLIQETPTPGVGGCAADGLPHLESIRIEDADDVVIRNSVFMPGSDAGSGHIFTSQAPDRLTLMNNRFGRLGGTYSIQAPSAPGTWTIARNTFVQEPLIGNGDGKWVRNVGPIPGCVGVHDRNLRTGSGPCQTDRFVAEAALGIDPESARHVRGGARKR